MIINKETVKDILAHLREPEMIVKTSIFFTMSNQDNSLDLTIDYIEPDNIHITDVVADGRTSEKIMRFELLSVHDFTVALIIRIES